MSSDVTNPDASTALARAKADIRERATVGNLIPVCEYTRVHPGLSHPPYLIELILADAAVRLPTGHLPTPSDYAAMFPEHASTVCDAFAPDSQGGTSERDIGCTYPFLHPSDIPGDLGRIGEYRVVRKLAEGGMGVVFEGFDSFAERPVAVKVIRPALTDRPGVRTRFLKEARAVAKLHHPNVLTLYHVDADGSTLFQVMPLLRGETLAARLARSGPLRAEEIVRLARGVADGLSAAHQNNLIHRDIKPSNLWLEPNGADWRPLILDFGLVLESGSGNRATSDGVIVGTTAYMSPEQANSIDEPIAARSDLFSLGVVLYEAATGVKVFERGNSLATIRATAEFHPPLLATARPDLPPVVADLIHSMLAKHPTDRPTSAAVVVAALDRLDARPEPGPLSPVGEYPSPQPTDRTPVVPGSRLSSESSKQRPGTRRWWLIPVAVVLVGAGLGLGAASGWFRTSPPVLAEKPGDIAPATLTTPTTSLTAMVDMEFVGGPTRKFSGGLRDAHTLPARPGDRVRAVVRISAPAYCYVFAVSSGGKVYPLYPWKDFQWGTRPAKESLVRVVYAPPDDPTLPLDQVNTWTITDAEQGMESVLAIIRTEPWSLPDEKIEALFAGLKEHHELENEKAFVAFDNGMPIATGDRTRGYDTAKPQNALNSQIHNLLARRLQPHAAYTTAVSFAKVEK